MAQLCGSGVAMLNLNGKLALVVGLGDTGLSMACYLARRGARVRVADSRAEPPMAGRLAELVPDAVVHVGPFRAESFVGVDLIAISPGVDRLEPLVAKAVANGVPLVGDVELFAQALAGKAGNAAPKVIAITGSNGKTTVTTMVGEMCRRAGLSTVVAGNIGLPVLDALSDADRLGQPDAYVLELSSFQLESTASLRCDAATVLNISEDHMDRYANLPAYAAAKRNIFAHAKALILNRDDRMVMAMAIPARSAWTFGLAAPANDREWGLTESGSERFLAQDGVRLMPVLELPLAGLHNVANALAALALCRAVDLPYPPLIEALQHFKGLPHRVEKVAEIAGVTYYDDSKGTNVGATVAAVTGSSGPVVLIAGGDGKGQDFAPLKDAVAKHARAVILIGRDAPLIDSAICASQVNIEHAPNMQTAVVRASQIAQPGDVVLLSPACASFDMFKNYKHRAEVFIDAVHQLRDPLAP
jgi:UDP-N-acetylmuramoylalanine--D-glutamate ligase